MLTEHEIVQELSSSRQIPPSFYRSMAGHEHPELRIRATWRWQSLAPAQREALLYDPDAVARLARHAEAKVRERITARPDLAPDLVAELLRDADEGVRTRTPPPLSPYLGRMPGDRQGHRARSGLHLPHHRAGH